MILFLGIATNKLLRADLPLDDPAQPWLMDVAAVLTEGEHVCSTAIFKRSVRLPKDVSVQQGAESVHGISTRSGRRSGATQRWVVFGLLELVNETKTVVIYGDMTRKVVQSIIMREAGHDSERWLSQWNRTGIQWVDLRTACTEICKLPREKQTDMGGYRWPSRTEAAAAICGDVAMAKLAAESHSGSAWLNMRTEQAIYYALRDRNVLEEAA